MSLCSQRAESKQHSLQAMLAYYQPKLNLAVSAATHAVSKQAYAMTSRNFCKQQSSQATAQAAAKNEGRMHLINIEQPLQAKLLKPLLIYCKQEPVPTHRLSSNKTLPEAIRITPLTTDPIQSEHSNLAILN